MNVLFLTLVWPENGDRHFFNDLMDEFRDAGHCVFVVGARERRIGKPTEYMVEDGINVLRVRCGNIQKTGNIEKGISSVLLGYQMSRAIDKYWNDIRFDLILYCTPPVTLASTVEKLKGKLGAKTYLMLKDIWPQGAVDLGMIKKDGLIWKFFRRKEERLYEVSDYIGCMSPANVQYVLEHNPNIPKEKVEECPNSIRPKTLSSRSFNEAVNDKYKIPEGAVKFIFGGNIGKPQGVGFIADVVEELKQRKDVFFIVAGSGTEYPKLEQAIEEKKCNNILLLNRLPKVKYDELCASCDVGLILLDKRFTIPNFPSRVLSYLELGMPIICATDSVCDMGDILEEWGCGFKVLHGDIKNFASAVKKLADDEGLRKEMAVNARKLLLERYTAKHSYEIIMSHFKR